MLHVLSIVHWWVWDVCSVLRVKLRGIWGAMLRIWQALWVLRVWWAVCRLRALWGEALEVLWRRSLDVGQRSLLRRRCLVTRRHWLLLLLSLLQQSHQMLMSLQYQSVLCINLLPEVVSLSGVGQHGNHVRMANLASACFS